MLHKRFQSAPLTEARGDCTRRPRAWSHRCFNPLPSPKQGETDSKRKKKGIKYVSIRSPHRSKGRHCLVPGLARVYEFQSAPLTEARGDRCRRGDWGHLFAVSIRSPHRSKGRQPWVTRFAAREVVSIRSPHRSKGRRVYEPKAGWVYLFQSAPLTEARGDPYMRVGVCELSSFNPLPSPKQGET